MPGTGLCRAGDRYFRGDFYLFPCKNEKKNLLSGFVVWVAAGIMTAGVPVIGMITGISEMAAANAGLWAIFRSCI